ncbi:MAG: VCBS repeat-containing protein, partial [Nitrospirae bacterium]|nr:VCBS repeat-containing protein [Nitrospirota bacterium]
DVKKGDTVRVSSLTKTRILFHQNTSVDYYLGDAYYKELKKTGKFDLVDAPIENLSINELVKLAREKDAEAIISLSSKEENDKIVLTQKLIWADGTVFGSDSIEIEPSYVRSLREGAEFLLAGTDEPLVSYDLPFDAELIAVGDVNGDKEHELLLSDGVDIYVYKYDVDLSFLYLLKGNAAERIVYLDVMDFDKDNRDEVIVSAISGGLEEISTDDSTLSGEGEKKSVVSYIYKIENRKFRKLWSTKGFLRIYKNMLLHQSFSPIDGFVGAISKVTYNEGFHIDGQYSDVPPGANIYNFVSFENDDGKKMYIVVDKDNFVDLKDSNGITQWRSPENLGGFIRDFSLARFTSIVEPKRFQVYDRLYQKGKEVFIVKREPLIKKAETAGYKSSSVLVYWPSGISLEHSMIIDKIPGELKDYYIFGDKIAVISKPLFGLKAKAGNILKGEDPFVDYLFIYSLKGR